jgi:hypothetical protein
MMYIGCAMITQWYSNWLIDWTTERSESESQNGQEFSLHSIQTSPATHSASYPKGTGASFLSGKMAKDLKPTGYFQS